MKKQNKTKNKVSAFDVLREMGNRDLDIRLSKTIIVDPAFEDFSDSATAQEIMNQIVSEYQKYQVAILVFNTRQYEEIKKELEE